MEKKFEKKLHFLTVYAIISTILFVTLFLYSFRNNGKQSFDEINVKRLNVLAEDGSLRMVISNETQQHPGRINGKDFPSRKRPAGILFFNEEGDECGGLIYWGKNTRDTVRSGMSFTMDQYHNDQVVQIINDENYKNGKSELRRGLVFNDIPVSANLEETMSEYREIMKIKDSAEREQQTKDLLKREGLKNRLFLGRNENGDYGLFFSDQNGRLRFRLFVDSLGGTHMQALDTSGNARNLIKS